MTTDVQALVLESLRAGVPLPSACRAARTTDAAIRRAAEADDDFAAELDAALAEGGAARLTVQAPPPTSAPSPTHLATASPPLPKDKLDALCDLVSRLPLAQQDAIVSRTEVDRMRGEKIADVLSAYPMVAREVAKALREVS